MPYTPIQLAEPIRIGFIGLSGGSSFSWGKDAHLPYLQKTSAYKITALLNTSIESARAARDAHGLPAETKLYDDPAELAKDNNVDLVVCSVRVDRHYPLTRPSIEAGKAVFVEWPLGRNIQEAEELAKLAEEKKVRTMIGLQGRYAPVVREVRSMIDSGRIGKLISVDIYAAVDFHGRTEMAPYDYFTQRDAGGNMVTIQFGHLLENVASALGELKNFSARLKIGRPEVDIVDHNKNVVRRVTKTAHDQLMLHGELQDSGAIINIHIRGGPPFKGEDHGLLWKMYGDKGEIRVKAPNIFLNVGYGEEIKLWLHDFDTDTLEQIDYNRPEENAFFDELPIPAQNIAREYELFAKAEEYPDFGAALLRHKAIEKLYESAENNGATVSYP